MVSFHEVNRVVVDQDFNKTEVILTMLIINNNNNNKMIIISHNKDEEVVVDIEVVIVVIIELVIVELIEIINTNKYQIQMLMLHHRQIQIDVIKVLLLLRDNNKINGMLVIGMVKHLFIQEQQKMMNNHHHHIQMIHLEVLHNLFFCSSFLFNLFYFSIKWSIGYQ
jgi:hypothetical protein